MRHVKIMSRICCAFLNFVADTTNSAIWSSNSIKLLTSGGENGKLYHMFTRVVLHLWLFRQTGIFLSGNFQFNNVRRFIPWRWPPQCNNQLFVVDDRKAYCNRTYLRTNSFCYKFKLTLTRSADVGIKPSKNLSTTQKQKHWLTRKKLNTQKM